MRWEYLKARNMGVFREVEIDFTRLPGTLVALCGEIGAGKSTLLEMLGGGVHRRMPSRGTLVGLATTRDSSLEVRVVNGHRAFAIEHALDAVSGKGTAIVKDANGEPVYSGTGVQTFDAWAKANITPPELLYASSFTAQQRKKRRNFLDLDPSERKGVILDALGLERLERAAAAARKRASAVQAECDVLRGRLGDLAQPNVDELRQKVVASEQELVVATAAVRDARVALERARAAAGDAARAAELAEQRRAAEARHVAAQKALADIDERLANNRALLARKDELEAAAARVEALDTELAAARATVAEAQAQLRAAREKAAAAEAAAKQASRAEQEARARLARAEQRLADRPKVLAAQEALERLRAREAELTRTLIPNAESHVAYLEQLLLAGKDRRIDGLRATLGHIASTEDADAPFQAWARTGLAADNEAAERVERAPEELRAAKDVLGGLRGELRLCGSQIQAQTALAARAGEMAAAEADRATAESELATGRARVAESDAATQALGGAVQEAERAAAAATSRVQRLDAERAPLAKQLELLPRLQAASARVEELTQSRGPALAAVELARAELATLPVVDAKSVDVGSFERGLATAEANEARAREQVTRARGAVEAGEALLAKRAALVAELDAKQAEFADWTRLGQDIGRDGLQAMEIDSVLPELNAGSNDLLHNCYGPRFTVELRTDALSKDGKKTLEDLEFRVIDSEEGREGDAESCSGGEAVIVSEAVSLALTMITCRRYGIERPTLIRDESGAALSPAAGRAYVAMLRRAAAQIGADKVIFVSHTPELWELADARIRVVKGRIEVA